MRILAVTNLYPNPYFPNRATFNRQQFAALAGEHEVHVIAPIAWTDEWSARSSGKGGALSRDRRRVCDGMTIDHPHYLFTPKVFRASYGHFAVRSIRRCFEKAVIDFRPDVVLGCWAYPDGWAAVHLAREARLPVVVKVHGSDLLGHASRGKAARTSEAIASADAVVAVSRHLGDRAIAMGANAQRVHVVYNGIDANLFCRAQGCGARRQLSIDGDEPLILFVGNLVPVKGIDLLIAALGSLAAGGLSFRCTVVGDGPLKGSLQSQIDRNGLAERVTLVGARPLAELPTWYQAADLLVLPSHSEGVPNVLLEASACGTPFIATAVGGIPEIAPPEALVPPNDVPALIERIGSFFAAPHHNAPSFSAGTWEDSARALARVLQSVTVGSRSAARRAA